MAKTPEEQLKEVQKQAGFAKYQINLLEQAYKNVNTVAAQDDIAKSLKKVNAEYERLNKLASFFTENQKEAAMHSQVAAAAAHQRAANLASVARPAAVGILSKLAGGRIGTAISNARDGRIGKGISGGISRVRGAIDSFSSSKVGKGLKSGAAFGAAAAPVALGALSAAAGAASGALNLVMGSANQVAAAFQPFNALVEQFDPGLVMMFGQAIRDLTASLGRVFVPITEAGTKVADALNSLFTEVGPVFVPIAKQFGDAITQIAVVGVNLLKPVLLQTADWLKLFSNQLGPIITDLAPLFKELTGALLDITGGWLDQFRDVIPPIVSLFRTLATGLTALVAHVRDLTRDNDFLRGVAGGMGWSSSGGGGGMGSPVNLNARTQAASPASIIGIAQIGEQARTAAFGARTAQDRTAEATEAVREQLDRIFAGLPGWLRPPVNPTNRARDALNTGGS